MSATEYQNAFAAISPSLYEAARSISVEQNQNQIRMLGQYLDSRRLLPDQKSDALWNVWGIGSGQYSSGSMTAVDGDRFASGGFLTGADRKFAPGTKAGIFPGYNYGQADFSGPNNIGQNSIVLGGYATYYRDGFHANSTIGAGAINSDVTRSIRFGTLSRSARSDTDGSEFFSSISGGYDFHQAGWTFGPAAGLQYSHVSYDKVSESGADALDLRLDDTDGNSFRSLLGGRASYLINISDELTLVPEARMFWQHEFVRGTDTLDGNLAGGSSPGFAYQTADSDGDSLYAGIGIGFQTLHGISGNLSYDIDLGLDSDANQTVSLGVNWRL